MELLFIYIAVPWSQSSNVNLFILIMQEIFWSENCGESIIQWIITNIEVKNL